MNDRHSGIPCPDLRIPPSLLPLLESSSSDRNDPLNPLLPRFGRAQGIHGCRSWVRIIPLLHGGRRGNA
ncbi:MAG: hypothetical protein D6795_20005 [Deltaproteobacteria bacterium]|nr:MAG: hypothetical protein D6795_20005 [Deltaproteobacteria bacterium]